MSPTIAVLALQGAFIEHEQRLQSLGCTTIELRQAADLARPFDGLVLPGGESTVQAKLLHDLGMFEPLRQRIAEGPPHPRHLRPASSFWPTISAPCPSPCAATPTAANSAASTPRVAGKKGRRGQKKPREQPASQTRRTTRATAPHSLPSRFPSPSFAPRASKLPAPGVEPLVTLNDAPVAVRHRNQIAAAFHPELDDDNRLYRAASRRL